MELPDKLQYLLFTPLCWISLSVYFIVISLTLMVASSSTPLEWDMLNLFITFSFFMVGLVMAGIAAILYRLDWNR